MHKGIDEGYEGSWMFISHGISQGSGAKNLRISSTSIEQIQSFLVCQVFFFAVSKACFGEPLCPVDCGWIFSASFSKGISLESFATTTPGVYAGPSRIAWLAYAGHVKLHHHWVHPVVVI